MKIFAVLPFYPPRARIGSYLATHLHLRHCAAQGHDVRVAALEESGAGWDHDGVRVETRSRGYAWLLDEARSADVVVSHHGYRADVARKAKRPSAQFVHGHVHRAPASASVLIFNANATRDQCIDIRCPTVVCPPPVDPVDHRVETTGDAITLVNLSLDKGIDTVTACAERLPSKRFLGVQGGWDAQVIPRIANFEVWNTQPDMRAVWEQTAVLLMPSLNETWGMVAIEAMASGIPVIAHPTPGLRESLGTAGVFVDRNDIDGWCEQIKRLDDPTEYANAAAQARQRVEELDPHASLDRFTEALTEVIDGCPRGTR